MSATAKTAVLPDEVWPSKSFPAPSTEQVLSHIANFLVKLGYQKTVKALNKEAQGKDVTSLDLAAGMIAKIGPLGRPLEDLYIDAFLQEDDFNDEIGPDPIGIPAVQGASSASDSSDSEEEEETSSDESSDEETVGGNSIVLKRKREETESESSSEDDSDETDTDSEASSSGVEDISIAPPIKKAKVTREASVDETETSGDSTGNSDSDDETSDNDSDSDSESDTSSDSSSEDDETSTTPTPVNVIKAATDQDSASESAASSSTLGGSLVKGSNNSGMHPARAERMAPLTQVAPHGQYVAKKSNVPFSRIPTSTQVDPRFSSNEYVSYDYADRAYQDLVVTKGKGFTKEKNKKKRGSYKGGFIDTAPKGIQFE